MTMSPETAYLGGVIIAFATGWFLGRRQQEASLAKTALQLGGVVLDDYVFDTKLTEPAEESAFEKLEEGSNWA